MLRVSGCLGGILLRRIIPECTCFAHSLLMSMGCQGVKVLTLISPIHTFYMLSSFY